MMFLSDYLAYLAFLLKAQKLYSPSKNEWVPLLLQENYNATGFLVTFCAQS